MESILLRQIRQATLNITKDAVPKPHPIKNPIYLNISNITLVMQNNNSDGS